MGRVWPHPEGEPGPAHLSGREIISYFGHMQCIGETPGFIEYRHGFEDVHVRRFQQVVREAKALFQINHPTTFEGPIFRRFCRGCAFELDHEIDWDQVDTIQVLNGPAVVHKKLLRGGYLQIENPFLGSAIELWERAHNRGHRVTAGAALMRSWARDWARAPPPSWRTGCPGPP
ncbi:MAG: hypothetical protein ABR592_04580 [Nitriliruptorales bacterium]